MWIWESDHGIVVMCFLMILGLWFHEATVGETAELGGTIEVPWSKKNRGFGHL